MLDMKDQIKIVKADSYINDVVIKNNISDEEIENNFSVFEQAYESLSLCRRCPGIDNCPQKVKGEVYTVGYSDGPISVIRYCKFLKAKKQLDNLLNKYVYTDIPRTLLSINLDNIECKSLAQELLFKIFDDTARGLRTKGVYLFGGYGVGKTYFVSALANTLVASGKKVVFVKCNSFATDMSTLLVNDSIAYEKLVNKIRNADYVIFDDIGTENVTAFSRDRLLYNILDYRMENKLCTIFTSNYDFENLETNYNQLNDANAKRICERIQSLGEFILLKGENQRHD